MTIPDGPVLRDLILEAVTTPAACVGDQHEEETREQWVTRAVLAVLDQQAGQVPTGVWSTGRHREAVRAANLAYRRAGGDDRSAFTEAFEAGYDIAVRGGRLAAAAALRRLAPPGRMRLISREDAARVAEGAAARGGPLSAVAALMDALPVGEGEQWTRASRDLLAQTFGNMLDLFHPAVAAAMHDPPPVVPAR